jgi:oxygen-independent coproporphyrinogen-3 oxidase
VAEYGAYVHIPFCSARCDYCAFATWSDRPTLVEPYLDAVRDEITSSSHVTGATLATVFVGGGTPSSVPAGSLAAVLARLPLATADEVTVECNPESVDAALLDTYVEAGVTRISLGVQSMAPSVLEALGRGHRAGDVERAISLVCDRPFRSWSVDLIYGAQGETLEDWAHTVDTVLAFDPPHVSAYALTVEPGTPLAADRFRAPDPDSQADKYELASERLEGVGRPWYELSNWARPGHECRHNLGYWSQGDYLGYGCASHSHVAGRRWWNARAPERYIERIRSGTSPEVGFEELSSDERRRERLALAVRTRAGVPVSDVDAEKLLDDLPGLLERSRDALVLTLRGRLLANEVAARLL